MAVGLSSLLFLGQATSGVGLAKAPYFSKENHQQKNKQNKTNTELVFGHKNKDCRHNKKKKKKDHKNKTK